VRLQVVVDHDVLALGFKAVRFEYHVVVDRIAHFVFDRQQRLHQDAVDVGLQFLRVYLVFVQETQEGRLTPLVAHRVFLCILVFGEVFVELVDAIVGEVDVHILGSTLAGVFLGLTGLAHQSFIVQLDPQRIPGRYNHLESNIEFVVVNEKRVVDLLTDDHLTLVLQIGRFVGQKYALALRPVTRFHNEPLVRAAIHFCHETA